MTRLARSPCPVRPPPATGGLRPGAAPDLPGPRSRGSRWPASRRPDAARPRRQCENPGLAAGRGQDSAKRGGQAKDTGRERGMSARKVIIDCDPGVDDALALVFAHGHPDLEICGITTVAGNVDLGKTTANALRVRDYAGMRDVPVVAGSPGPLLRPALDARHVHGSSGLGAASIPVSSSGPADGHAVDYLGAAIGAEPGQVTLIAIG